jgi:hypothetical protein
MLRTFYNIYKNFPKYINTPPPPPQTGRRKHYGLINFIDTKAKKCRHLKRLTCIGTMQILKENGALLFQNAKDSENFIKADQ